MAQWSDTIYAHEEVSTGQLEVQFSNITDNCCPSHARMSAAINRIDASDNHQLYITIDKALHTNEFTCSFELSNTGTVPIRLASPTITRLDRYWTILGYRDAMDVYFNLPNSIDPGQTAYGTVTIHNNASAILTPGTYYLEAVVPCYQWNQVNEQWWEDTLHIDGQLTASLF